MTLEELQQALANETDATKKAEIQAQIDAMNNVGKTDSVPTDEIQPKSALDKALENIKDVANGTDSEKSRAVNNYINLRLANGENPSAKYLKQKIVTNGLAPRVKAFLDGVGTEYDFVVGDVGKGIEYIKTNIGTVCSMDDTKYVPDETWLQENHTYIDTLDIAPAGKNNKTWCADRSKQTWKYVHYFLSGKEDELINGLIADVNITFANMMFKKTFSTLADAYTVITTNHASSTEQAPTSYLQGSATTMMDAVEELRNFAMRMLDDNTQFNYGYVDSEDQWHAFEDAPNHVSSLENLKFVVNQETYNAVLKYLPYAFNRDDFINYLMKPSSWIIVPKTYQDVDITTGTVLNGQPTLKSTDMFVREQQRIKGTVMILAGKNDTIKWGTNFEQNEMEYYPQNATTQFFNRKNLNCKILKWAQLGVYENEHLEDPYSIPVSNVN